MDNKKMKIFVFILLIIALLTVFYYEIIGFSVSYLTEDQIKNEREVNNNLIDDLKINNIDTIYNEKDDIYFYSIPSNFENKRYTIKLDLDNEYKYKILDYATNIIDVDYSKIYRVLIYNEKYYKEIQIQLTNLPLINITTDTEITDNETNSIFTYINPSNLDKVFINNSKIKIRGASTKNYDKKSYKVEFYNNGYDKEKNVNISNFYNGSSFVLDATYRDNSKIRNAFATQLWNLISDDFNNVNVYTEFVEVFINNEYKGVYAFSEPINRKKLSLNKSSEDDTSVVVKSSSWEVFTKKESNILDDSYLGYELKYPNAIDLFTVSWKKISNKLSNYYSNLEIYNNGKDINVEFLNTYEQIINTFNLNNYIDMLLFNSFINNNDNKMIKNNYFYLKNLDSNIYIQPWDMEFTFGLNFSHDINYLFDKDINDYNKIDLGIYHENSNEINKLIKDRYFELRENVLNEDTFNNILDNYLETLNKGSANRDSNMWNEYDVKSEIEDIRYWINNRLKVYDEYIKGFINE